MTTLAKPKKADADFLNGIREASTDELRRELAESLRITAERLLYLAAIVQELERRGDDLRDLRLGMVRWLRLIAAGHLLAEIVVRFAGKQKLLDRLAVMPLAVQKRLLDNPVITVLITGKANLIDALELSARGIDQVFADDHLRDEKEQAAYLASQGGKKRRSTEELREREPRADIERKGIRIGKSFVPLAKIMHEVAILRGPLEPINERDYETATMKVSKEEKARLRAQEKLSGMSEWQLLREWAHACGGI